MALDSIRKRIHDIAKTLVLSVTITSFSVGCDAQKSNASADESVTSSAKNEDFVLIPAGEFKMGRTSGDDDKDAPPVTVYVSAFYMARHEVTETLWNDVVQWGRKNGYTDLIPLPEEYEIDNHPISGWAEWEEVIKWCNAKSEKDGFTPCYRTDSGAILMVGTNLATVDWTANGYRLPSEAEWEKAARGGVSGKRFPWGDDTISHSQANYTSFNETTFDLSGRVNGGHPSYTEKRTSPVGSFPGNGYGLHDMAGNVSEWCWDWHDVSTYANGVTDPRGPDKHKGFPHHGFRVVRGGSWEDFATSCRAAARDQASGRGNGRQVGFRLARSCVQ